MSEQEHDGGHGTQSGDAGSGTFWFNPTTGEVEEGRVSPWTDRMGPYPTREAAATSPGSGLPPGCMNTLVPALRTNSTRRSASTMMAAET